MSYQIKHLFRERDFERLTKEVNILLISDLHYDITKDKFEDPTSQAHFVTDQLIGCLKKVKTDHPDWEPDIVIAAGDLVNKSQAKNYCYYFKLIDKLTGQFNHLKNAVFSTPGNHDIDRNGISELVPFLAGVNKERAAKVPDIIAATRTAKQVYIKAQDDYSGLDETATAHQQELLAQFEAAYFKTFLAKRQEMADSGITGNIALKFPNRGLHTTYYKDILGIRIASVNSSFFCKAHENMENRKWWKYFFLKYWPFTSKGDNDRNQLFFISNVIKNLVGKLQKSPYPVITFMHHPFFYMHESEYIYPVSKTNNNFTKITECSDMILCGHVHGEFHKPSVMYQQAYTIINGTTYTYEKLAKDKSFPFTFALIKVNKQLEKFQFWSFIFNDKEKKFIDLERPQKEYPFQERGYQRSVSTELEKINVIQYLKEEYLEEPHMSLKDIDFDAEIIVTQLSAYLNWEINELGEYNTAKFKGYTLKEKEYHGLIIKIEDQNPFEDIAELVTSFRAVSDKPEISFAINIKKSINDPDTTPSLPQELEIFYTFLKVAILRSKYDHINLNFLYY